ncbi:MAG: hypothetical protein J6Y20_09350 [Lachnospiraceae bacterium]|nr:hypothetical protein [Lachnospiraceae bacterium]
MKDIIIVCAGTYGLEVLSVIDGINYQLRQKGLEEEYNVLGFLDDNPNALDGKGVKVPIIGKISDWQPKGEEVYSIGAAFPKVKEKLATMLKQRGCKFETLIAPWSIVSDYCTLGEGCFITAYSISAGVTLGDFVNINASSICAGSVIGDYSTTTGFTVVDHATVGKGVFIGSHAVVVPGVTIGDGAQISVGSIVTSDVEKGATVFGVPAVQIG